MNIIGDKMETASQNSDTVVLGTVKGDLHDIGKNLVAMMKKTIEIISEAGLKSQVKIVVGRACGVPGIYRSDRSRWLGP